MKKLLSLLGIMGLSTTASVSVVACGKADGDTSLQANGDLLEDQLQNLIAAINDAFNQQLNKTSNLVQVFNTAIGDATENNEYFYYDNLINLIEDTTKPGEINLSENIEDDELAKANSDIKNLFGYLSFKELLANIIAGNADEFSLITTGIDSNAIISDMQLSEMNLSWNAGVSQISLDAKVSVSYKYSDINHQIVDATPIEFPLTYTMVDNEGIQSGIKEVQTQLKTSLYEQNMINLDDSDFALEATPFLDVYYNLPNLANDSKLISSVNSEIVLLFNGESNLGVSLSADLTATDFSYTKIGDTFYSAAKNSLNGYGDYNLAALFANEYENKDDFVADFKNTSTYNSVQGTFTTKTTSDINSFLSSYNLNNTDLNAEIASTGIFWGTYTISNINVTYKPSGSDAIEIKIGNVVIPFVYSVSNSSFENLIDNNELKQLYEKNLTDSYDNVKRSDWAYVIANDILKISKTLGFEKSNDAAAKDLGYIWQIKASESDNDFWKLLGDNPTIEKITNTFLESDQGSQVFLDMGINVNNIQLSYLYRLFFLVHVGYTYNDEKNKQISTDDDGIKTRFTSGSIIAGINFSFSGYCVDIYTSNTNSYVIQKI